MRSISVSLKLPNMPSLLMLPRSVMPLPISHTLPHLVHGSSIMMLLIISLVIRIFSPLIVTSPLPMITLANRTQTIAKGIGSTHPLPSLPLKYILSMSNSPFNLITISKLTNDLNCSITFSYSSVTLQDRSTRRTIDIGRARPFSS